MKVQGLEPYIHNHIFEVEMGTGMVSGAGGDGPASTDDPCPTWDEREG